MTRATAHTPERRDPREMTDDEAKAELWDLERRFAGPFGRDETRFIWKRLCDLGAFNARKRALSERLGREPWQRRRDAVRGVDGMPEAKHREYVRRAVEDGKPVPACVLDDYPELRTPR